MVESTGDVDRAQIKADLKAYAEAHLAKHDQYDEVDKVDKTVKVDGVD